MPQNSADIYQAYQTVLGRTPTQAEANSFNQYANNGSIPLTTFDIQQILQGTPEYQQNQLQNYGGQYQNFLGASDQRMLGLAQNAVTQQFAQQGRNIGSSGYLNAFANAAANLAMSRQQQLAGFYGGGFQGIMGNAAGQAQQAQGYGQAQQSSTLGFVRQQQLLRQYQDMLNQQNAYNRRAGMFGSMGSAIGGLAGAGLGGAFGGLPGAQLGAGLGSSFGQAGGLFAAGSPSY